MGILSTKALAYIVTNQNNLKTMAFSVLLFLFSSSLSFAQTTLFSDGTFSNFQAYTEESLYPSSEAHGVFYSQLGTAHAVVSNNGNPGNSIVFGNFGSQVLLPLAAPLASQTWTISFDQILAGDYFGGPNFRIFGTLSDQSLEYEYTGGVIGTTLLSENPGHETTWTTKSYILTIPAGYRNIVLVWWFDGYANTYLIDNIKIDVQNITTTDTQSPSLPTGLNSTNITATSFNLSWTGSTDEIGVAYYTIYRDGVVLNNSFAQTMSITNLTPSTTYTMSVTASDAAGNTSAISSSLNVSTIALDVDAPSVPMGLSVSNIAPNKADLSWNESTDNVGVTGYRIYSNGTQIGTSLTNSYTASALLCNTAYSFSVRAFDLLNNTSVASSSSAITTLPCEAVTKKNLHGINLGFSFVDYSEDRMFADVMMMSRGWTAPVLGWEDVAVDANGWPLADAELYVWAGIGNMHGTYKLSFTGQASILDNMDGPIISIQNKVYNSSTNTTTCDLIYPSSSFDDHLRLRFTGTIGGVKNVKMMRPITPGSTTSYPTTTIFTNEIKSLVSKFSCIRFMDYFNTNLNKMSTWSQRPKPSDASQQFKLVDGANTGGCLEYAIMLCNETGTDIWLNLNVNCNDDFITKAAQLIRYGSDGVNPYTSVQANPLYPPLNSNLKVYLEYGNEVWNSAVGFTQMSDNFDMAVAEVTAGNSPLNFDGSTYNWDWAFRRVGKRIVDISNIFRSVYGDANMMTRIRPILCGQLPGGAETQLKFIDQIYTKTTAWCSNPHPVN